METIERILITENSPQIEAVNRTASNNVARLNAAYEIEPFKTFDELRVLVTDCPKYTRDEMRKDQFTANLMDRGIDVDVPAHLIRRTRILTEALECFEFTRPTKKGFDVDAVEVEAEADKFRRYIETPYQAKTWDYQNRLLEVLNSNPLPTMARRRNYLIPGNDFLTWSEKEQRWVRNNWALFHENDFTF